jgi:RNA polymerase sigma-70 factor (ECF subfamily)
MQKTDAELIESAKHDKEQFKAIYDRYIDKVYNYFWYRVGHDQDVAEDLAQETFVKAYQALARFTVTDKSYLSYLLTIAHNVLVNYYRSPQPISIEATQVDVPQEIWSTLEKKDNIRSLWRAVQYLPSKERDILYLKYQKGYKISEIAEIIDKSPNAVKLSLSRIRKKLSAHPYLASLKGFSDQKKQPRPGRYQDF